VHCSKRQYYLIWYKPSVSAGTDFPLLKERPPDDGVGIGLARSARLCAVFRDTGWVLKFASTLALFQATGTARDPMFTEHQLLGDIGATNARFALLANGILGSIEWLEVARYARFTDAVADFLSRQGEHVGGGLFAVAGPVVDGRCALTNSSWLIDAEELRSAFGLAKVRVINDFEATASALPDLTAADLRAFDAL
jgi:hypothetical protein